MASGGAVNAMRLIAAFAMTALLEPAAAPAERTRVLVDYGGIIIETVVEGAGPAVVLLPPLARGSDDYDTVAEGLAGRGASTGSGGGARELDRATGHAVIDPCAII
jgi:hypothetical protein